MIKVQEEIFDPAALLEGFVAGARRAGAIVSFVGLVRPDNDGGNVARLELQHHPRLTETVISGIAADARDRFGLADHCIVHRYGALSPGEPIVFVAAAAPHRRAAFEAVDYMMDRLKTEAPFWKCEQRDDGRHWLEARSGDHTDAARWKVAGE